MKPPKKPTLTISVITLFPALFEQYFSTSILGRGAKKGFIRYQIVDLRPFGEGVHQVVDGKPFGGGVGMVLRADILAKALKSILPKKSKDSIVLFTSPSGTPYVQAKARQLASYRHVIIICGHYEGIDQRFIDKYVDAEISIGDYVLTGGELPAMIIADSIVRLVPGVLEKAEATQNESFTTNLLEYPHYTRPAEFEGMSVPEVLISGHHQKVEQWREAKAVEKTQKIRPDLLTQKD